MQRRLYDWHAWDTTDFSATLLRKPGRGAGTGGLVGAWTRDFRGFGTNIKSLIVCNPFGGRDENIGAILVFVAGTVVSWLCVCYSRNGEDFVQSDPVFRWLETRSVMLTLPWRKHSAGLAGRLIQRPECFLNFCGEFEEQG